MNAEEIIQPVEFYTNILVSNKIAEAVVNALSGSDQLELFKLSRVFKDIDIATLQNIGFKDCHEYYNYHFEVTGTFMTNKDYDRLRAMCVDRCTAIFDLIASK